MDETLRTETGASPPRAASGALVVGFSRYRVGTMLGRGGMGIVHAVDDAAIGREVAIKRAKDLGDLDQRERLLAEARLQGRLEHPGVVPVYDVGEDERGEPYFTMRRLRGATLAEVLTQASPGDESGARWTRARLLGVVLDVAQAVAYAHGLGVVHRDLKPANVMLGDFGEVYVLDWGIAHDVGSAPTGASSPSGTPGYMAPEQLAGAADDARADVFALGAILFEVLAQAPLVPRGPALEMASVTLLGVDVAARLRQLELEVPPELVAICTRATALDREDRYPNVQQLVADLQRFLDGDRDVARRRALSAEHTRNATALLSGVHGPDEHVAAMRELGRALALDHHNRDAMVALSRALTDLPLPLPAPLLERREQQAERLSRRMGLYAAFGYGAWLVLGVAASLLFEVDTTILFAMVALVGIELVANLSYWRGRFAPRTGILGTAVMNALLIGTSAELFGVVLVGPLLATATTAVYALQPYARLRWPLLVLGACSFAIPWMLERAGVIERAPLLPELPFVAELSVVLFGITALCIVTITITNLSRRVAEREGRSELQAWYLGELAPGSAEAVARLGA